MKVNEKVEYATIAIAYWLATASSMAGFYCLGEATQDASNLGALGPQRHLLSLGIVLQLLNDGCVVLIGLLFYNRLRLTHHWIGLVVLVTRLAEATILLIGKLGLLSLALLAEHKSNPAAELLGLVLQDLHGWSFVLGMLPLGLGGAMLSLFLWKHKAAPGILAALGIVGYFLLFAKSAIELFFIQTTVWLFLPVAIFEFVFPIWLLSRGLKLVK